MTRIPATPDRPVRRAASLDGLRGLAAFVVVLSHVVLAGSVTYAIAFRDQVGPLWARLAANSPLEILWSGPEFVLVFFVLSGYVLALGASRGARFEAASFYPARLLRLYLPVWGAIGLALVLHLVVHRSVIPGASYWLDQHAVAISVSELSRDLALTTNPDHDVALNPVLWSLRWEVLFSLLLPAFLWVGARCNRPGPAALAALVVFFVIVDSHGHDAARFMPVFLLGVLLAFNREAIAQLKTRLAQPGLRGRAIKAGALVLAVVLMTATRWAQSQTPEIGYALATFGAALMVLLPLISDGLARPLESRVMQWLGSRSFSLYLVHEPILVAVAFLLHGPAVALLAAVAIPLALLATEPFYRFIERPAHGLARRAAADGHARAQAHKAAKAAKAAEGTPVAQPSL